MEHLPAYLSLLFIAITILTVMLFYRAANRSKSVLFIVVAWLLLQGILSATGFYTLTSGMPPRFALPIIPPFALIAALFLTAKGREFIDRLSIRQLTMLHCIRIPVELGLLGLYLNGAIPGLMTFEGRNFDLLSGLSAPVIFYIAFIRRRMGRNLLLAWNIACLGLLANIVVHAILAAPFDFQQIAFEQPNRAVFYFPFVCLPCCIVPIVLLAHLTAIRQLIMSPESLSKKRQSTASPV